MDSRAFSSEMQNARFWWIFSGLRTYVVHNAHRAIFYIFLSYKLSNFKISNIERFISSMWMFYVWNLTTSCRRHLLLVGLSASLGLARANFPRSSFWPIKWRGGNVTKGKSSAVVSHFTWPVTRWEVHGFLCYGRFKRIPRPFLRLTSLNCGSLYLCEWKNGHSFEFVMAKTWQCKCCVENSDVWLCKSRRAGNCGKVEVSAKILFLPIETINAILDFYSWLENCLCYIVIIKETRFKHLQSELMLDFGFKRHVTKFDAEMFTVLLLAIHYRLYFCTACFYFLVSFTVSYFNNLTNLLVFLCLIDRYILLALVPVCLRKLWGGVIKFLGCAFGEFRICCGHFGVIWMVWRRIMFRTLLINQIRLHM